MTGELRHHWRIDPAEYRRHEHRRGRRHAYEVLDARHTALVVVDMVPFFVHDNPYARGIVEDIRTLAGAVRDGGGTVVWVVPVQAGPPSRWARGFHGDEIAARYAAAGGPGAPRTRLWPGLGVDDADPVVEKATPGAFRSENGLPALLTARSVDTVVIAGVTTDVCCESSVREAASLGHRVVLAAEATATGTDAAHNATLRTVYRSFGDVRGTAELLDLLRA